MVSNPPKVSFIPKSPLAQEESFLMRRRPRSITAYLAVIMFTASVGSYGGFYFYKDKLSGDVAKTAESIASAQREFLQSPVINEAKVFKARADLARELLNQHIVISPVFAFLSSSTLGSILYDSFSFKRDKGTWTLSLTGEAPSYASLAYQADVLRKKNKDGEIVSFFVDNISLTKSGTVTFALAVEFAQSQLLYTNKTIAPTESIPVREISAPVIISSGAITSVPLKGPTQSSTTPSVLVSPNQLPVVTSATTTSTLATSTSLATTDSGWTVSPVAATSTPSKVAKPATVPVPAKSSFWSWFKFW